MNEELHQIDLEYQDQLRAENAELDKRREITEVLAETEAK